MNYIKKLPLTMAVVAALCPISVLAQEFTQEQIDAIVAKAVDKALAERQAKMDAAVAKKRTWSPNHKARACKSPGPRDSVWGKFTGYARYGAHFQAAIRNTWR